MSSEKAHGISFRDLALGRYGGWTHCFSKSFISIKTGSDVIGMDAALFSIKELYVNNSCLKAEALSSAKSSDIPVVYITS
jgi:hypothetical protein